MKLGKIYKSLLNEWAERAKMEDFTNWFSMKSNIPVGAYLGSGVEGEIYEVDKNRVIKFGYESIAIHGQHLANRKLDGIVKVYQTGQIEAPKKFKYPSGASPDDYEYYGIELLDPNRSSTSNNLTLGYMVMERLYPSKELEKEINFLDETIWREFATIENVPDENGRNTQKIANDNLHPETIKALGKRMGGFGNRMLINVFESFDNQHFMNDLNSFIKEKYPNYIPMLERFYLIFKNLKSIGMEWDDIHSEQFALNGDGNITAVDISFGSDQANWDPETKTVNYDEPYGKAIKQKIKNKIREKGKNF